MNLTTFARSAPLIGLILLLFLAGCRHQGVDARPSTGDLEKSATEGWVRVVRGVNGTSCDAANIGSGNDPVVGARQDLTNLSVSCSANRTDTVKDLRQFLPNAHVCSSTLRDLRKARREVVVVRAPETGNPFHCELGTITPNQFVSRAKFTN